MITEEESIPSKNKNYRLGEDVFYYQFNDISFYIEDDEQENFFFEILKKLFPDVKIEKIFPLGGKKNVIEESRLNIGNKKKVFIVDLDFDDLLGKVQSQPNLFYLERYSIENFLIEKSAIVSYVIGEKPRLRKKDIESNLNLDLLLNKISKTLKPLIELHLVVQAQCPTLANISLGHERFVQFTSSSCSIRIAQLAWYKSEIQTVLSQVDRRLTVNGQIRKVKKIIKFSSKEKALKHYPGKYLVKIIQELTKRTFSFSARSTDSFCYHLAKNCSFNTLTNFKNQIKVYVNT